MEQIRQSAAQTTLPAQDGPPDGRSAHVEAPAVVYSSWRKRAMAHQIDHTFIFPFIVLGLVLLLKGAGHFVNPWALFFAMVSIGFGNMVSFYNRCILMGTTGQSWGKRFVGIRLVSEATGEPIGVGNAIVRELAHIIDIVPVGLGMLLPAVDRKRQTGADKIANSIVIDVAAPRRLAFRKLDD
jgi:uncharacterized RDD family membrane protein YckC